MTIQDQNLCDATTSRAQDRKCNGPNMIEVVEKLKRIVFSNEILRSLSLLTVLDVYINGDPVKFKCIRIRDNLHLIMVAVRGVRIARWAISDATITPQSDDSIYNSETNILHKKFLIDFTGLLSVHDYDLRKALSSLYD